MSTLAGGAAAALPGRPAAELDDAELESQGTQAHATRNWVFLHGTAEQFARHTSRMLELEQEYLRRYPHRTWQGSGGAATDGRSEAAALREALRGIVAQLDALAAEPAHDEHGGDHPTDPVLAVLAAVADAPAGRLHKLEVHQAAREAGLDRAALAALYTSAEPLLVVEQQDRVLTDAGRDRLRGAGRRSGRMARSEPGGWQWVREEHAVWDDDKRRIIGGAPTGIFELTHAPGASLPGDWWSARRDDGTVIGYGWMDIAWGDAEVLLAVDPDVQGSGAGAFVLDHLEQEAAARGLNYVYNTVAPGHPQHDYVQDWLGVRGYRDDGNDRTLRKQLRPARPATVPATRSTAATDRSDEAAGREDLGGYVDVEDHSY